MHPDRKALDDHWRSAGWYADRTVGTAMAVTARDRPAVTMTFLSEAGNATTSLALVHAAARRVAGGLTRLGLRAGDAIVLQLPNSVRCAITVQAAFLAGLVVVPVIHTFGATELSFILRQADARAIVIPDRWHTTVFLDRIRAMDAPENVMVVGNELPHEHHRWDDLLHDNSPDPVAAGADDLAAIIYTSGTTRQPKGVRHTHNTLLAQLRTHRAPPHTAFSPSPAGHIASLLVMIRCMAGGTPTVMMDRWDAVRALDALAGIGPAHMNGAPFFYNDLFEQEVRCGRRRVEPRTFQTGGAAVAPMLIEAAEATGRIGWRNYGSSEIPTLSTCEAGDTLQERAHTDGRPAPGTEVEVLDRDGNPVARGRPGEIVARAPQMFVGYTDPAMDADAFLPGAWFRTGDVGVLDERDLLTVTGRIKDVIIRGGENISAKEIEDILVTHPAVLEAAVVPIPDSRYGERACAVVRLRSGQRVTMAEVGALFSAANVSRQKTPEYLVPVDHWPRTGSGKVKKAELLDKAMRQLRGQP